MASTRLGFSLLGRFWPYSIKLTSLRTIFYQFPSYRLKMCNRFEFMGQWYISLFIWTLIPNVHKYSKCIPILPKTRTKIWCMVPFTYWASPWHAPKGLPMTCSRRQSVLTFLLEHKRCCHAHPSQCKYIKIIFKTEQYKYLAFKLQCFISGCNSSSCWLQYRAPLVVVAKARRHVRLHH